MIALSQKTEHTMFIAKLSIKMISVVTLLQIMHTLLLPKLTLLLWVVILMGADLATGILKAKLLKETITSDRARRTIIKFLQYFGCIGLVVVLINQNNNVPAFVEAMNWAKDGVTILIIYIECLSVFENLYAMDKTTTLSLYFIRPIYWILSFAVRNNPLKKAQDDLDKGGKAADPSAKNDIR